MLRVPRGDIGVIGILIGMMGILIGMMGILIGDKEVKRRLGFWEGIKGILGVLRG